MKLDSGLRKRGRHSSLVLLCTVILGLQAAIGEKPHPPFLVQKKSKNILRAAPPEKPRRKNTAAKLRGEKTFDASGIW